MKGQGGTKAWCGSSRWSVVGVLELERCRLSDFQSSDNGRQITVVGGAGEMPLGAPQLRINAAISRKHPALDSNAQRYFLTI